MDPATEKASIANKKEILKCLKDVGVHVLGTTPHENEKMKMSCQSPYRHVENGLNVAFCSPTQLLAGEDFAQALPLLGIPAEEHQRKADGVSKFILTFDGPGAETFLRYIRPHLAKTRAPAQVPTASTQASSIVKTAVKAAVVGPLASSVVPVTPARATIPTQIATTTIATTSTVKAASTVASSGPAIPAKSQPTTVPSVGASPTPVRTVQAPLQLVALQQAAQTAAKTTSPVTPADAATTPFNAPPREKRAREVDLIPTIVLHDEYEDGENGFDDWEGLDDSLQLTSSSDPSKEPAAKLARSNDAAAVSTNAQLAASSSSLVPQRKDKKGRGGKTIKKSSIEEVLTHPDGNETLFCRLCNKTIAQKQRQAHYKVNSHRSAVNAQRLYCTRRCRFRMPVYESRPTPPTAAEVIELRKTIPGKPADFYTDDVDGTLYCYGCGYIMHLTEADE